MPSNYLEQLIAEWYEFQGYFIRRNVLVGRRSRGGYDCELGVVAFHPTKPHLVHIEPSMDADSWEKREHRFSKKFAAGRKHIPKLFEGLELPGPPEQIAVLVFGRRGERPTLGGGRLMFAGELLEEIFCGIRGRRLASNAIPEQFPILKTFQFVAEYHAFVSRALGAVEHANGADARHA
jgi:hypothetical protein